VPSSSPFLSNGLRPVLRALGLVGLVGVFAGPASAAPTTKGATTNAAPKTTAAECTAANQSSTKLQVDKKLRQALAQAVICSAASCSAKVRAACKKRAASLNLAIPTIVFAVKDSTGHDVTDVRVSVDGDSLADHIDATALSVDPGQHTFTFDTGGQPSFDQSFLITEAQKDRHETITLPAPPPPPPPPVVAATDSGTSGSSGGTMKLLAYGLGGVGLASIVVGGVMGGLAISKWHDSESECGSPTQCPNHTQSVSDHNTASTFATVSTITLIAGGVALATGVTLFFVAPKKTEGGAPQGTSLRVDPLLGPGVEGLKLEGLF
jgi:hypothetical protein